MGTKRMANDLAGCNNDWKAGLFGCTEDISNCLMGWCCFPCLYGQTSDIVADEGCMKPCLLAWCCNICNICCYAPTRRDEKFRKHFKLNAGSPLGDTAMLTWCCCSGCANCQEMYEVKARGIVDNKQY